MCGLVWFGVVCMCVRSVCFENVPIFTLRARSRSHCLNALMPQCLDALQGSVVFVNPDEITKQEIKDVFEHRFRLDSALFFGFMLVWFGWQEGYLVGSLLWASSVSCVRD